MALNACSCGGPASAEGPQPRLPGFLGLGRRQGLDDAVGGCRRHADHRVYLAQAALVAVVEQHRREEGAKLAAMVLERGELIRALLHSLRQQLPALQRSHREKLLARMASLDLTADPVRLEEEIVYVLQRTDVEEEMDRLGAHLDAINEALMGKVPCGRKLDFLMQELNREANTLGSKSTALDTTNTAIEFKVLIEQMREQIQNIE